ncbi:7-cyano-7-deazaguanine synthase [Eubacteriales bacterium OttesenSCG-928-A19]|nr:7-cyano-7-deazaguanine synthase [Eubacteriales bacterium OttesenSCG-928-A19]
MQDILVLLGAEVPSGRAVGKKLRSEQYCCRLMPSGADAGRVREMDARGIVIAGEIGEGAVLPDPGMLSLGIPVLAVGGAARALLATLGRRSETHVVEDKVLPVQYMDARLFAGLTPGERWVDRAEYYEMAEAYRVVAYGEGIPLAYASADDRVYLLQFPIERNDLDGLSILRAFASDICGCTPWWTPERMMEEARGKIIDAVGEGEAICAISGGLDSTVAALLAREAIGDRAQCVFVDTGLLRTGEAEETEQYFARDLGMNFRRVDASARVLSALAGLEQMDDKWRVIEEEIDHALLESAHADGRRRVFIKGTNYNDMTLFDGQAKKQLDDVPAVEPLAELFKSEIRMLGKGMNMSPEILSRQPFPGMGLAARIRGEVTPERLDTLRRADALFEDEITLSGQGKRIVRYFSMLHEVGGLGVIILRALQGAEPAMTVARLPYDLLERTVERILTELPSVERVFYDMTPGMAEWPLV